MVKTVLIASSLLLTAEAFLPATSFHGTALAKTASTPGATLLGHGLGCTCGLCSRGRVHAASCTCLACRGSHGTSCSCAACRSPHGRGCTCASCLSSTALRMSVAGVDTPSSISAFAARLAQASDAVTFEDTMEVIAANYEFAPKPFTNGDVHNAAGTNEGSCKVFSFGKLAALDEASTLSCFGQHYRDVLADPAGAAHANIRSFMEAGWGGVHFPEGVALTPK